MVHVVLSLAAENTTQRWDCKKKTEAMERKKAGLWA